MHDKTQAWSYSVWCTGERELYDLAADPLQVTNLLAPLNALGSFADFKLLDTDLTGSSAGLTAFGASSATALVNRLDALLLILKTCKADTCRRPWAAMFPGGEVRDLQSALNKRFDEYFAQLPKIQYQHCALGYLARNEKPEWEAGWAYAKKVGVDGDAVVDVSDGPTLTVQS